MSHDEPLNLLFDLDSDADLPITLKKPSLHNLEPRKNIGSDNPRLAYELDAHLIRQIADDSTLLKQTVAEERALLKAESISARFNWDASRRLEAVKLGARLARNPELIAAQLRQTKQGAEWLLTRWNHLADALKKGRPWTEKQRKLALDLTGAPPDLRDPDLNIPDPPALAQQEIAALTSLRDFALLALDEESRDCSSHGTPLEPSRAIQAVRRRHASLTRSFHNAYKLLNNKKSPQALALVPPAIPTPSLSKLPTLSITPLKTPVLPANPPPTPISPTFSPSSPTLNRLARRAAEAASRRR